MSSTYSYTAASGKRPEFDEHTRAYTWFRWGVGFAEASELMPEVFMRLEGGVGKSGPMTPVAWHDFPTEAAALAAADAAARQAIADGVWTPEGGKWWTR